MALFDFDGLEDAAAAAQQGGRWLALQPTGDVASRLCAVASAELLAADTGRELVVRWAPEIACDAPWRQLFRPEHGPRQLLGGCHGQQELEPALRAADELLGWWDRACRSEPHPELRGPAVERFGQCHRLHLHAELAALVDSAWLAGGAPARLRGTPPAELPGFLRVRCACVRATGAFYPAGADGLAELASSPCRLARLKPAQGVSERVQRLPGLAVCVHARGGAAAAAAEGPDGPGAALAEGLLQAVRPLLPSRCGVLLLADDPGVARSFRRECGPRLLHGEGSAGRASASEAVMEELAEVFSLAQGFRIVSSSRNAVALAASLLSGAPLVTVALDEGRRAARAPAPGSPCPAPCSAPGPREQFFVAGSWDGWAGMEELKPTSPGDSMYPFYAAAVEVRQPPRTEEFQVLQGRGWQRRFHPGAGRGEVLGPDDKDSGHWRVRMPEGCCRLRVFWDPRGARCLEWRFVGQRGAEWREQGSEASCAVGSGPYFLAGSWDDWASFQELGPVRGEVEVFSADVPIHKGLGSVEFQVMEDRDWGRSFFPMSDEPGALIMGPSGWQGGSWWTEIPKGCRLLHVVWDLRGSRSLEWTFFGRNGRPLKPPVLEGPFFLAGSWNSWQEFAEFVPQAGDGPPYVASVEVGPGWKKERFEEFNILQGQDWGRCFYPARAGSKKIHGPVDGSWAPVWRVRVAPACMRLQVVWDPRGARSVGWRLLGQTGEEVSTAPPQRWTPKKIGGWRISGELGRGWAGGVVYTAEWEGVESEESALWHRPPGVVRAFWVLVFQRACPRGVAAASAACRGARAAAREPLRDLPPGPTPSDTRRAESWRAVRSSFRGAAGCPGRAGGRVVTLFPSAFGGAARGGMPGGFVRTLFPSVPRCAVRGDNPGSMDQLITLFKSHCWFACDGKDVANVMATCQRACAGIRDQKAACLQRRSRADLPPDRAAECAGPDRRVGEVAALKHPVPQHEIEVMKQLGRLSGVPTLLDHGCGPDGMPFLAIPVLGRSLEEVLHSCDHDGLGGRTSWPAARALGARMLRILQDIHGMGIVHCDIKPGNVLVGADASVHIIDFGLSSCSASAHFEQIVGTVPYNSVRSSFSSRRAAADDLESIGWVVLKCILGRLPWESHSPGATVHEPELWRRRSEGMSLAKELFLDDPGVFGKEFDHCPQGLQRFLQQCCQLEPGCPVDYARLAAHFEGPSAPWASFINPPGCTVFQAARGLLVWRARGPATEPAGEERACRVRRKLVLRTTGLRERCAQGREWLQVDPVWAPGRAEPLTGPSWVLLAGDDAGAEGPLLVAKGYLAKPRKQRR